MAELTARQAKLLEAPNFAHVATIRRDGSPHVTAIWVDWDGEHILLNSAQGRAKVEHIRRDPRVAVSVSDNSDEYRNLRVRGTAEIVDEGEEAWRHIDKLQQKYHGSPTYPRGGPQRVLIRVKPERVTAYNID
jgi:PPOX class probable F420-dependent enzyme